MKDDEQKNPPRLCTEIQLFDLCDKEACSHRAGRYCTHGETLARFEAISEVDDIPEMIMDDLDEMDDDMECDDASDADEYEYEENEEEY